MYFYSIITFNRLKSITLPNNATRQNGCFLLVFTRHLVSCKFRNLKRLNYKIKNYNGIIYRFIW